MPSTQNHVRHAFGMTGQYKYVGGDDVPDRFFMSYRSEQAQPLAVLLLRSDFRQFLFKSGTDRAYKSSLTRQSESCTQAATNSRNPFVGTTWPANTSLADPLEAGGGPDSPCEFAQSRRFPRSLEV